MHFITWCSGAFKSFEYLNYLVCIYHKFCHKSMVYFIIIRMFVIYCDIPRRQDRMTLNVKNRIESDKKLVFFIVGLGMAFIVVGLFLLLLYRLYHEDIKEVKPVIVIGKICHIKKRSAVSSQIFCNGNLRHCIDCM